MDRIKAVEKQYKKTILRKIRHIAKIRNGFCDYGQRAEELIVQEDKIEQKMLNKNSIDEIIKYPGDKIYWLFFISWLIVIIGVPVLFLLEILKKL